MTEFDPKRPPAAEVLAIADQADSVEAAIGLIVDEFPGADVKYLGEVLKRFIDWRGEQGPVNFFSDTDTPGRPRN